MKRIYTILMCLLFLPLWGGQVGFLRAGEGFFPSFRGAWIATVANIDWPSKDAVGYSELQQAEMTFILDSLQSIGINATVTVMSQARLQENIKSRNYDLALIGVNLSEVPNMSAIFGRGAKLNFNGFGNDSMELYLKQATAAGDEDALKTSYSAMQMYVVNRLPILGLLFRTGTVLSNRSLGGMTALRLYDAFNGFEFLQAE